MKKTIYLLALSLLLVGCNRTNNKETEQETVKETIKETEKETQKETIKETEKETQKETETEKETEKEVETEAEEQTEITVEDGVRKDLNELSVGGRTAALQAEKYLQYEAFSKNGLSNQLKIEGYPEEDIEEAFQYLHVNWKEKAVEKAVQVVKQNNNDISTDRIKGILTSELGFTPEEADYAIDELSKL